MMPVPPPPDPDGATPALAQWFAAKSKHPDALVFFRMGDFFELFFGDAEAAATVLDIQLTARGEHAGQPIPMCGVPAHAADAYLLRLIRKGFRVAIADQVEDAKARSGKAPIRREVVRLVTPGTLTEEALLEGSRSNILLSVAPHDGRIGTAWIDISTGLFETAEVEPEGLARLLARLDPAEILAPADLALGEWQSRRVSVAVPDAPRRRLAEAFGVASLSAFGSFGDAEVAAAAAAIDYVRSTQAGKLPRLSHPAPQTVAGRMEMDASTRASLEIVRARDGTHAHTLLSVVDHTLTAAGARLLAEWLVAPLVDAGAIRNRQDGWRWLLENQEAARAIRTALRGSGDMARALARVSLGRGGPRDLAGLRDALAAAARCRAILTGPLPPLLSDAARALEPPQALVETLSSALAEPVPLRVDDSAIASGFDPQLDAERRLRDDSRRIIATMQLDYAQRFGVASLKIKHHQQLGYVIEVPAASAEKLRAFPELSLRQGTASGARLSTPELADLDRRIAEASDRAAARERAVFATLCGQVLAEAERLAACASALAALDVAQSCARLAEAARWCRPTVSDDPAFSIVAGRHPVVEAALAGRSAFVPNDCDLSGERRVLLLTGPNMAGKSTFLRQNALTVVLAQAGLPVPAEAASLGIVDRLFSRVGAADDLARGLSTFMVEMTETAAILHQAGPRSLVVVDEIGRGTATLDGLAIAWAVLEALHNAIRCRVIFATHFHELAGLSGELPRLAPHTMRIREYRGEIVFQHEVIRGAARRSFGVQVARLAGIPPAVVKRAASLLTSLEARAGNLTEGAALPLLAPSPTPAADPLREAIATIEPDRLSPREALQELYRLKELSAVAV